MIYCVLVQNQFLFIWVTGHLSLCNLTCPLEATQAMLALAEEDIKIRIDDPDKGAWMPKTKADARPTIYPNAIGHNRIHRQLYYCTEPER